MLKRKLGFLIVTVAWLAGPVVVQAQFENKALHIGEMGHVYTETGGQQEYWNNRNNAFFWPAINNTGILRADAQWLAAQNVQSEEGDTYAARIVHVGPRATGSGAFFPLEFRTVSRYEPPSVTVDGLESFFFFHDNDEVDPGLPADRMIELKDNTLLGITLTKRIFAYSQEYHDSYHVQEYVLTNTGNVDEDEEAELNQTLEGVYLHFQRRYTVNQRIESPGGGWGANVMNDIVGDGMEDYDVDFTALYTWLGNFQNGDNFDELGTPIWGDHSWKQEGEQGRLTSSHFAGVVHLHADTSPSNTVDDPAQPSTTGHIDADDPLTSNNDPYNETKMQLEYDMVARGHMYPHHADAVDLDGNFLTPDGDPMIGKAGGWQAMWSYGPYTLAPGESVRVVMAEGVDGLNMEESSIIGKAFYDLAGGDKANATVASGLATTPNITYRGVTMGKNQWWWTGRDSLFQTFERAIDAYGESGGLTQYPIPEPPRPPATFAVESGVDQVSLSWTTYDGADPAGGFELYRTENYLEGRHEKNFVYDCIAGCPGTPDLGPSARSFDDTQVVRGIQYYYYIQSVGAVNTDPAGGTPTGAPLKSNRYWTQTYDPASLKRPPGETTSSFKVVPNPFNVASQDEVRWPGPRAERLGFLDVPGDCTIRIYTERGDLVKTIRHDDGSGDEFWDLTTESQQLVVSGLYIVAVDDHTTGDRVIKKFVVIR